MINYILFIALGLLFLIYGGNALLKAAVGYSLQLNIPKIVIGMTVVSFATSAPELIVSAQSALKGYPDMALGNVIGSNIANLALVLGITVLFGSIHITKNFYKTDWPIMMFATGLLYFFVVYDKVLERTEGIVLLCCLVLFLIYIIRFQKVAVVDEMPEDDKKLTWYKNLLFLVLGGLGLWAGSEVLILGTKGIAKLYNISDRIISITLLSIGTSIPELATSIIAMLKKEKAISLGNLIGSNIFNIFVVLGITSIIEPIHVNDASLLNKDIIWVIAISFIILPLVFFPVKNKLTWREGIILLALYLLFIIPMFF